MNSYEIPRRNRIDLYTPAEKAIYDAKLEVEKLPADPRLTDALLYLQLAQNLISDFVDLPKGKKVKCTRCKNVHFESQRIWVKNVKQSKKYGAEISDLTCPKCSCKITVDVITT